jgi:thiamine pyrophosphokinase
MTLTLSPYELLRGPYTAVLLIQTEIDEIEDFIEIWNKATFRVAVDGGANHWHSLNKGGKVKEPHIICGDFDSIDADVRKCAEGLSTIKVIPTPDQDHTDFTKALQILQNEKDAPKTIVALVSNRAGRYDQQFGNLNTLIKSLKWNMRVYLYDHVNIIFPIPANTKTEIQLRSDLICGIVPLNGPTRINSSGLKWNLDDVYGFGGVVSTSNKTEEDVITLESGEPLIFTAQSRLLESQASEVGK